MKNYIPKSNDLIIFTNNSSAILSEYNLNNPNYKWSQSIVSIEPNQSALVIDSYIVDHNSYPDNTATTIKIATQLTNIHKPHIPSPPTILVVSLSNLILEVLYDPDVIQPFPHPSNYSADIKPSIYLIMAK